MSKQIHFVVCVDLDSKKWWVDDDSFSARFGDGEGTWDTETEEWSETSWDDNIDALDILNPNGASILLEESDTLRGYLGEILATDSNKDIEAVYNRLVALEEN